MIVSLEKHPIFDPLLLRNNWWIRFATPMVPNAGAILFRYVLPSGRTGIELRLMPDGQIGVLGESSPWQFSELDFRLQGLTYLVGGRNPIHRKYSVDTMVLDFQTLCVWPEGQRDG